MLISKLIRNIKIYLIINYEYVNKDNNQKIRYKVHNPVAYLPVLIFSFAINLKDIRLNNDCSAMKINTWLNEI